MVPSVEPFPSFFCRLYHDEVGIHTFEMHYHFSLPDEQALLQDIWKNIISTSPRCPHNRQMVSLIPGLHAQMLSTDVGQILKLIINPRVMVDGAEGYCRITDSDSNTIRNCIKKFNRYWKDHNITPIRLKSCRLTRMDLCMNIEFGDDFSIPLYLDLLKRTPHDRRLSQQHMKDPEDDHHVYKISNLRRALVVYDKLYEQKRRFRKQEFDCQNLMRIEYQLGTRALRQLCGSVGEYETKGLLQWVLKNAGRLLCEEIRPILCVEPYVSSEKIRSIIQRNPNWKESTKKELWQLQLDLYRTNSYDAYVNPWDGMEDWRELSPEEKKMYRQRKKCLAYILKRYELLGICPAALRRGSGPVYLPSLYQLVCAVLADREQRRRAG